MNKLVIPLYIPSINNNVDYLSLENIIKGIENSIVLIGNYNLNNLSEFEYLNVYMFLEVINPKNEYYMENEYNDELIKTYQKKDHHIITKLGNIFSNEINEYLINEHQEVSDKSLNKYLKIFKNIVEKNERDNIIYILKKQNKIYSYKNKEIDNLIGISEI